MILLSDNIGPVQGVEHIMSVFPKFHCELNAIEQCWCHAKKYSRQYVNESIIRLRKVVPQSLATCPKEIIRKFFDKCRSYVVIMSHASIRV